MISFMRKYLRVIENIKFKDCLFPFVASALCFTLSCGGGGGGEGGSAIQDISAGIQATENIVTLRSSVSDASLLKSKQSEPFSVKLELSNGEELVMQHTGGGVYSVGIEKQKLEHAFLVTATRGDRQLRKLVMLDEFNQAVVETGELSITSTSFSYLAENEVLEAFNTDNWLEGLISNQSYRNRLKARQAAVAAGNTTLNSLIINTTGTGEIQVTSHLNKKLFGNTAQVTSTHNSNVGKTENFPLSLSGPVNIVIKPDAKAKISSFTVHKGVNQFESGARYNTKYDYYENSAFIDHQEITSFAQDIKLDLTFSWIDNAAPIFNSTPTGNVILDKNLADTITATDANGDTLTYNLVSGPDGMSIDSASGALTWQANIRGEQQIALSVTDGEKTSTLNYTLQVVNTSPVITSSPTLTGKVGTEYSYTVTAEDADGDTLLYELVTGPTGMAMDNSGKVTWTPTTAGSYQVIVRARDDRKVLYESTIQDFMLTVQP